MRSFQILYTEVCWLLQDKVPSCLHELREKFLDFLKRTSHIWVQAHGWEVAGQACLPRRHIGASQHVKHWTTGQKWKHLIIHWQDWWVMCKLHGHVPTDISCTTSSQAVCCICQTPSDFKNKFERYFPCVADTEDNDWIRDPFNQESSTEKLILRERCAEFNET